MEPLLKRKSPVRVMVFGSAYNRYATVPATSVSRKIYLVMPDDRGHPAIAALEAIVLTLVEKGVLSSEEAILALEDALAALRAESDGAADLAVLQRMVRSIASACPGRRLNLPGL